MTTYSFNRIVNSMTNWENTMWSREGYPGLAKKSVDSLLKSVYARMTLRRLQGWEP